MIGAAQELHAASGAPARDVSAPVQAQRCAGAVLSRISRGQEFLRAEVWAIEVAPSQSVPREVHLTDDPGRNGTELFVEDVHAGIRRGNSDRHGKRAILLHVVAVNHATDRGLCWAILVVDLYRAAEVLGDLARQLSFEILAAHDELANPRGP